MRKLCLGWWPVVLKAKCIQLDMWIKGTLHYTALMSKKVYRSPRSRTQASHVPVFAIFYASVHWLLTCLHGPVMTAPHFYEFPGWYLRGKLEGPRQLRALWSFCSGALVKRCWPELLPTGAIQLHAGLLIREQGRPKWLRPLLSTVWDSTRVQCAAKFGVTWSEQFSSMTYSNITLSVPLLPPLSKEISVQRSSHGGQCWSPDPPMSGERSTFGWIIRISTTSLSNDPSQTRGSNCWRVLFQDLTQPVLPHPKFKSIVSGRKHCLSLESMMFPNSFVKLGLVLESRKKK